MKKEGKMEVKEIFYFDEPGPSNTDQLLESARKRIGALGIRQVIIASQAGYTVKRFLEIIQNVKLDILAVTNVKGGKIPVSALYNHYEESKRIKEDYQRKGVTHWQASISDEDRRDFEKKGVRVFYSPDILNIGEPRGLDDDRKLIRSKLNPFIPTHLRPLDIEAGMDLSLLNIISMGFRVCVGIIVVSVRNGLVSEGETVLSIAGTGFAGGGADTAVIAQAHSNAKACLVKEILGFPKSK
jgi:hypothetical protein